MKPNKPQKPLTILVPANGHMRQYTLSPRPGYSGGGVRLRQMFREAASGTVKIADGIIRAGLNQLINAPDITVVVAADETESTRKSISDLKAQRPQLAEFCDKALARLPETLSASSIFAPETPSAHSAETVARVAAPEASSAYAAVDRDDSEARSTAEKLEIITSVLSLDVIDSEEAARLIDRNKELQDATAVAAELIAQKNRNIQKLEGQLAQAQERITQLEKDPISSDMTRHTLENIGLPPLPSPAAAAGLPTLTQLLEPNCSWEARLRARATGLAGGGLATEHVQLRLREFFRESYKAKTFRPSELELFRSSKDNDIRAGVDIVIKDIADLVRPESSSDPEQAKAILRLEANILEQSHRHAAERQELERRIETLGSNVEGLQTAKATAEQEARQSAERIEELMQEMRELHDQMSEANAGKEEAERKLAAAREELATHEEQAQKARADAASAGVPIESRLTRIKEHIALNSQLLLAKVAEAERELAAQQTRLNAISKQFSLVISSAETQIKEATDQSNEKISRLASEKQENINRKKEAIRQSFLADPDLRSYPELLEESLDPNNPALKDIADAYEREIEYVNRSLAERVAALNQGLSELRAQFGARLSVQQEAVRDREDALSTSQTKSAKIGELSNQIPKLDLAFSRISQMIDDLNSQLEEILKK